MILILGIIIIALTILSILVIDFIMVVKEVRQRRKMLEATLISRQQAMQIISKGNTVDIRAELDKTHLRIQAGLFDWVKEETKSRELIKKLEKDKSKNFKKEIKLLMAKDDEALIAIKMMNEAERSLENKAARWPYSFISRFISE